MPQNIRKISLKAKTNSILFMDEKYDTYNDCVAISMT